MTATQIILSSALYLAVFALAAWLTRARWRRIAGAAAGGAVFGVVAVLAVAFGQERGWWRVPSQGPSFQLLVWLGFAVSCAPFYLVTWRVARRFGARGLAVCAIASALIGPPRDYTVAAVFPQWIAFSPGAAPVLAVAAIYFLLIVVGHAAMRLVAGPAQADPPAAARHGWSGADERT